MIPISSLYCFFSIVILLEFLISFNYEKIFRLIFSDVNHLFISLFSLFLRCTISSNLFHDFDRFLNYVFFWITRFLCIEIRELLFFQFSVDTCIFLFQDVFTRTLRLTELIVFLVPIKLDFLLLVLLLLSEICAFDTYRTFAPKLLTNVSLKPFLILVIIWSLDVNVMLHAFL